MRRSLAIVLLGALIVATPVAAMPTHADQTGPSLVERVLEVVTGWVAKLGVVKSDPDERDDDPPLDGLGPQFDPWG